MALVQSMLKNNLLSLFNLMKQTEMSEEDYADRLSKIINDHILTAEVKPGITVSVTGTAAAQSGSTTGTGELA